MTDRLPPPYVRHRRDRVLTILMIVCAFGVCGSVAAIALLADKLVAVLEPTQ